MFATELLTVMLLTVTSGPAGTELSLLALGEPPHALVGSRTDRVCP